MLRILNNNILLAAVILLTTFGLATLVAPSHAQALASTGGNSQSPGGFEIGSLRNVAAACTPANCADPAISCNSNSSHCNLIQEYVVPTINLLSVAFGLIAVISLLLGAINYITSEGDPQKVSRAKVRIRNTVFSIVAFMFLYAFLNFLIPGGIFK
jgi:hypothetical protein